ncbi:hypothetical protein GCM10027020_01470 [Nocardioides salsibiostraticola]
MSPKGIGRRSARAEQDPIEATEAWFLSNGLPYFVPGERRAVREGLRPRRLAPLLAFIVVLAVSLGGGLAFLSNQFSLAPAILISTVGGSAVYYALTALRARPILKWALRRSVHSLRLILPVVTRGLPLLLLFVTFLFINAEVWQVAGNLRPGTLWLTVLMLAGLATLFLIVRLPEEVDKTDDEVDDRFLTTACAGTPMQETCGRLIRDPKADPASYATIGGFERWNLILTLMIIQAVQVLLLVISVFVFFLLFGALAIDPTIQQSWTGQPILGVPFLNGATKDLFQVSVFLAAFSGLYFTISAVTDETYRGQFFGAVIKELERAVGVRAVYLAARKEREPGPPT